MKILYGDPYGRVDLSKLSEDNFFKVKQYFHSFGYNVFYDILPLDSTETITPKKNLKDYYLRLRTDDRIYVISFDFYIGDKKCTI